jgi:hypothetical protein
MRLPIAIAASAVILLAAGCSASSSHPATSPSPLPPDPRTAAALLTIARAFNHDCEAVPDVPEPVRRGPRLRTLTPYGAAFDTRHKAKGAGIGNAGDAFSFTVLASLSGRAVRRAV